MSGSTDVRELAADRFERMSAAWNRADGTAFGDLFTEDAEFVDIRGGHNVGRAAIAAGHQGIFDTIYAGSTVAYEVETAHEVVPGCVVAVVHSTLDAPSGPLQGRNEARITAIITRRDGVWALTGFHNTLVQG